MLNKKSLESEHPNEFAECIVEGKATEALVVNPGLKALAD